jgi:hypothetical protein
VTQGTLVEISVPGGALVIRPVPAAGFTLEELLAGVTEENLHRKVDYGAALGEKHGRGDAGAEGLRAGVGRAVKVLEARRGGNSG